MGTELVGLGVVEPAGVGVETAVEPPRLIGFDSVDRLGGIFTALEPLRLARCDPLRRLEEGSSVGDFPAVEGVFTSMADASLL